MIDYFFNGTCIVAAFAVIINRLDIFIDCICLALSAINFGLYFIALQPAFGCMAQQGNRLLKCWIMIYRTDDGTSIITRFCDDFIYMPIDFIGFYHNIEEAEFARKILEERNAAIVFPKKYISNSLKNWNVYEQKSEYLILERNIDGGEGVTQLRNEFGKLIDHKTENGKWKIYAKFPCLEEETFWAYGYSPKTDRKTFDWIYENFALAHAQSKYDFVNIYIYNNKVIFRYDNKDFNFVLCKNTSDAIRMYNLIEERSKKNKQIIMTGGTSGNCDRTNEIVQMIKEKTGWPLTSIRKSSTRH